MVDVTPKLLKTIQDEFQERLEGNDTIKELYKRVKEGSATYKEANDFAINVGQLLSASFENNLSAEVLPDGKMYYNIADRILRTTLGDNHKLITDVTSQVQTALNKSAGIGIKAIVPDLNIDRIEGLVNKISSADDFSKVAWLLDEPIVNFSQSIVDDSIKENADFQYKSGMTPKIERTSTGKCCDWCNKVVGTYEYPDVPKDVYRRHNYCRCKVDYIAGKYRKNVHNNNTGKRRYVQDKYGGYELSKEARLEHAKQMAATEKVRKEQARQKRIDTWAKKKESAAAESSLRTKGNNEYGVNWTEVKNKSFSDKYSKLSEEQDIIPDTLEDVKQEYYKSVSNKPGKVTIEENVRRKNEKDAIQGAEILTNFFGDAITVLEESNIQNVKNPDYLWRGRYWDHKKVSTVNAVDGAVRSAIKQIKRNPGGIVLDISDVEGTVNDIYLKIEDRIRRRDYEDTIDIILIKKDKIVSIIRHKKR